MDEKPGTFTLDILNEIRFSVGMAPDWENPERLLFHQIGMNINQWGMESEEGEIVASIEFVNNEELVNG